MIPAPIPENEEERIRWLDELGILDTVEEQAYDDLALLASHICGTPIALVSLVDRDRQWFKSHLGLATRETPREYAFCSHAILDNEVLVVEDSDRDERFHDNPLATGKPYVKFYAGAPLILRDNIRLGTLCVIDNKARRITPEQKQALKALARQVVGQMELGLRVKELQRLDRAKDEFVAMVSHELRTPLTSINGALSLLHHNALGQLDPSMSKMVEIAHRNAERLLCIANDILDLAKIEAGRLKLNPQPTDLVVLAEHAIDLNRVYCAQCNCHLEMKRTGLKGPVIVSGDGQRLLQILSNLISNAAKFTHEGDTVEVSLATDETTARVNVTDHGPGITPEQRHQLFQRFTQTGANGNRKLPGTGLGLVICKELVEMHEGTIGFESLPGEHTTFYFSLPLLNQTRGV